MADPLKGRYTERRYYKQEFETAKERLAPLGGAVIPGTHDYEAFVYEGTDVRLIFYPHKTSSGNYHIRLREGGRCHPMRLREAIYALAENSCTFQFPANVPLHNSAVLATLRRRRA